MTAEVSIYLVDDDASYLRSLARLLSFEGYRVHAFQSGRELLEGLTAQARGCIVADLRMPGMDGLALQAALVESKCRMPIVFLTGVGDISSTVRAMRSGAVDFVEKCAPKEALLDAIRRALDQFEKETEGHAHRDAVASRMAKLTPREREVLGEVILGRMNKQIAARLGISERTVKMHRTSITTKIGVHSVAQLTTFAHEAGILGPSTVGPKPASDRAGRTNS
ncbi:MAG TPA: response regulator [Gemmatimonadales bacterium]|nr:response regulator [Gemmatimonadales bacterium]